MTYNAKRCSELRQQLRRMENAPVEFSEFAYIQVNEQLAECCANPPKPERPTGYKATRKSVAQRQNEARLKAAEEIDTPLLWLSEEPLTAVQRYKLQRGLT